MQTDIRLDKVEKDLVHQTRNLRLELKSLISTVEADLMNYMKRQENRLEVIEVKLGQISIDEESRAWTMARLQEESLRILEQVKAGRDDLEGKVAAIYSEHLHVEGLVGPTEDCEFRTVHGYTEHRLSKIREDMLQAAKDVKTVQGEQEKFEDWTTEQFTKKIPQELFFKQESINECKRLIGELE